MEEDEERREALQKIVDVLLEGGYFRARISSLSPFDKLIGGLAWCITAFNADIDIDYDLLFYDDEATLGEKIMVGEAIEAALQNMACPFPLQAHQIQGLDYQAVYPVVQWLVKRVLAMRKELGDEPRRFSHLQFEENYQLPEEAASKQALQERLKGLSSISVLQQPKRLYRQAKNAAIEWDPTDRIRCTLLEYGLDISKSALPAVWEDTRISSGSTSFGMHKPHIQENKNAGRPGSHFSNITRSDLALSEVDDGFLSRSKIRQLFDLCGGEIQSAFTNYALSHDDHGTWKQRVAALLKKIEKQENYIEQYKDELNRAKSALEILDKSMKDQDQKLGRVKTELNCLNENVEKEGATSIVETLVSLLQELKSLENKESDFCKQASEQTQAETVKLTSQILKSQGNDEYAELEITLNREILTLESRRIELAKKHRAVALLQRQLDDIPTQTELVQFEHRFIELYEHIQARLRETRRYYGTYNVLAEANELTLKETSLLSSINSQVRISIFFMFLYIFGTDESNNEPKEKKIAVLANWVLRTCTRTKNEPFEGAMVSASGRAKLIESMEGIDKGIRQKLGKMQTRFQVEQSKCNALKEKYGVLLAEQRHYSALVKSFQDECARNEKLQMELNGLNVLLS